MVTGLAKDGHAQGLGTTTCGPWILLDLIGFGNCKYQVAADEIPTDDEFPLALQNDVLFGSRV